MAEPRRRPTPLIIAAMAVAAAAYLLCSACAVIGIIGILSGTPTPVSAEQAILSSPEPSTVVAVGEATSSPKATPRPRVTATLRPSATQKPTVTSTSTRRSIATRKPTATRTRTPWPTRTPRPTATPTRTPSSTVTPSPTVTATPRPSATPSDPLQVHFIDVGQGDAILILAPSGEAALIDGGDGGSAVVQYLRAKGVQHLDMVIASHPHADHIGGLVDVLQGIPVDMVVTNGEMHTTNAYERFLDAIAAARAQYREVRCGDALQLGALTLQVLHPASLSGDLNDDSLVLRLRHDQVAFLFTGDVQSSGEASMLASGQGVEATIFKVAHHGSHSSSTTSFLSAVKPKVAVYSCGADNSCGHRHAETLVALDSARFAFQMTMQKKSKAESLPSAWKRSCTVAKR